MGHAQKDRLSIKKIRVNLQTHKYLYPTNLKEEKAKFFKNKNYNPQLKYHPFPKQSLKVFKKQIEAIKPQCTDNLSSKIHNERLKETKLKLRLFSAIGTPYFTRASMKLYRLKFASYTLKSAKKDAQIKASFKSACSYSQDEIVKKIKIYLKENNIKGWQVFLSKRSDFYFQIFPKSKLIKIGKHLNWEGTDLEYFLAHEVDGHVLRAQNASCQKNKIFANLFPFYIKTEEGLATYLGSYHSKNGVVSRKNHAVRYLAGKFAMRHSFAETYKFLVGHSFSEELAFQKTLRLKRGFSDTSCPGVYAREAIYYEGMLEVKNFLDKGGDIKKLYAGKVGLSDIDNIPIPKNQIIPSRLASNYS